MLERVVERFGVDLENNVCSTLEIILHLHYDQQPSSIRCCERRSVA